MDIQQIDMTGQGEQARYLEVLTDAGIVRVNVNLIDTHSLAPVVVVEVEPNLGGIGMQKTAPGGHWVTEVRDRLTRTEIAPTRNGPR